GVGYHFVMRDGERIRQNNQAAAWFVRKLGDSAFDLRHIVDRRRRQLDPKRWRRSLEQTQIAGDIETRRWVEHRGGPRDFGRHSLEQLQHLSEYGELHVSEPGDVAPRMRQIGNEALPDRLDYRCKNDGYGAGLLPQRSHDGAAVGQDHFGVCLNHLCHESPHTLGIAEGPTSVDAKIAAFRPTELLQPLA